MVKPLKPRPPRKPFLFKEGGPPLYKTKGTPMPIPEIQSVYNTVCSLRIPQERFDMGQTAQLSMYMTGWIMKSNLSSYNWNELPPIQHEYMMYEQLANDGLMGRITPNCMLEEGVFGYPDSIVIQLINFAATIEEYAVEMIDGRMSKELWIELCNEVGKRLYTFHQHGYIHGDLHAKNVVIGITKAKWDPYLIDFGSSYHPDVPYYEDDGIIPNWEELNPQADIDYLLSELHALDEGDNNDYAAGLRALEDAALGN